MSTESTKKTGYINKNVFLISGAYCAYMLGSAFSTGQEEMQYYTVFGLGGALGALIVFLLGNILLNYIVFKYGFEAQLANPHEVFEYYLGKKLAFIMNWYAWLMTYGIFVTMLAGAGAMVNQYFNVPIIVGTVAMGILAIVSVMMDFERILDVIGRLGPITIVFCLVVGIGSILKNPAGMFEAAEILPTLNIPKATPNWLVSGLIMPCFCMISGVPFMASCGASCKSMKEVKGAAVFSTVMIIAASAVVVLGHLCNLTLVADQAVPNLTLAENLHPFLGVVFAVVISLEIYNSTIPQLWSTARKFAKEGTKSFRILAVVFAAIAVFFGELIPFATLVNVLYPFFSYTGFVLAVVMIVKTVIVMKKGKKVEE